MSCPSYSEAFQMIKTELTTCHNDPKMSYSPFLKDPVYRYTLLDILSLYPNRGRVRNWWLGVARGGRMAVAGLLPPVFIVMKVVSSKLVPLLSASPSTHNKYINKYFTLLISKMKERQDKRHHLLTDSRCQTFLFSIQHKEGSRTFHIFLYHAKSM